jgi:hypothetical protein
MSCNEIEVIENQQTIEITNKQKVIELDSDAATEIEITDQKEVIELETDITKVIEVTNVNATFVGVGDNYEVFIPTTGQTIFTLSNSLTGPQITLSKVFINGQKIAHVTCYTISGTQLTVILPYSLNSGDTLEIYY